MEPLSIDFIGWFYTIVCGLAIFAGVGILLFMHARHQLAVRYKNYSIWNDIMLIVIWFIGLAGGVGVVERNTWGPFLLQLFCWMLIALSSTSGATRLYTLHKLGHGITRPEWIHSVIGVVLVVLPVVLFCFGTILSLRTEAAQQALGVR